MAKIAGKDPIVHKLVFELKYNYGFSYLDRCGRTVNSIMRERPDWILANPSPNPQNAPLVNTRNNCRFNFSALKLDFLVEQPLGKPALTSDDVTDFVEQVEDITAVVIESLALKEFTRMGFRVWYLFECKDTQDTEEWLESLGCYSVPPELSKSFGGTLQGTGFSALIQSEDRQFRISFNGAERSMPLNLGSQILNVPPHALHKDQKKHLLEQIKEKKRLAHNPRFAAMIDIDAYLEMPELIQPAEFVKSSYESGLNYLRDCVSRTRHTGG